MKAWLLPAAAAAMILLPAAPASSQAAERPDVRSLIQQNRLEIRAREDGSFEGAGWEQLIADGAKAQFFIVGEQHGASEIINVATAIHERLARHGYSHAAMEVGPYSTAKVEQLIRSGPGKLAAFIGQRGQRGIFPFLTMQEEVRLAEQLVRLSSEKPAIWGIDQEYVGAAPLFVELLSARQSTPAQRAAVTRFAAAAAANKELVKDLKPADLQPLTDAFRGDAEALAAIEALRISSEIYAPFTVPGSNRYWANHTRETLMKRNFAAAFARAEHERGRPPKVFMKLGGNHAMRGFSATYVPGFANFLAEWGVPRGFETVNIMIDCYSSAPGSSCRPYLGDKHAIHAATSADRHTLFDLRPVRAQLRSRPDIDTATRDLVQAFDYYLMIRDVTRGRRVPDASPEGEPK